MWDEKLLFCETFKTRSEQWPACAHANTKTIWLSNFQDVFSARVARMCTVRISYELLPCETTWGKREQIRQPLPEWGIPVQSINRTLSKWSEIDSAEPRAPGQHCWSFWMRRKPLKGGYPPGWWLGAVGIETTEKTKLLEQYPILCYSEFKWLIYFVVPQRLQPLSRCSNDPLLQASLQSNQEGFLSNHNFLFFFFFLPCWSCLIS